MIHLNKELMQQGIIGCLAAYILPELYMAMTVQDFMGNKDNIRANPLSKLPVSILYLGEAWVGFTNVDLHFEGKGYAVKDMNSSIYVHEANILSHRSAKRKNMEEGRYSDIIIRYFPSDDRALLHYAKKLGPPAPDKKPELEELLKAGLVPVRERMR